MTVRGAHASDIEAMLTRLVDMLDDRAADLFDERLRAAAADRPKPERHTHPGIGLMVCSLALGVAATAVSTGALATMIVIWSTIGAINLAYARWS